MNRIKALLLAAMLTHPGIGHADALNTLAGSLVRGAVMKSMFEFGSINGSGPVVDLLDLDGGYSIVRTRMPGIFGSNSVIVTATVKKNHTTVATFEMDLVQGKMTGFRTISENTPGWAHERNSSATGGNDRGSSDSM